MALVGTSVGDQVGYSVAVGTVGATVMGTRVDTTGGGVSGVGAGTVGKVVMIPPITDDGKAVGSVATTGGEVVTGGVEVGKGGSVLSTGG